MKTRRSIAYLLPGGVVVALGGLVWALPALAAEPATGPGLLERLWRFAGIFHPLVVHFPVALLTLAAIVEGLRLKYKDISPHITLVCLVIAALGSIPAVIFGWARAGTYESNDLLFNHRWLGVGLTVFTVLLAGLAVWGHYRPQVKVLRIVQTVGVFAAAALVGLVGHLGAELTHGEAFVGNGLKMVFNPPQIGPIQVAELEPTEPPEPPVKETVVEKPVVPPVEGTTKVQTPAVAKADPVVDDAIPLGGGVPVDFLTQVWPIFQKHCVDCHGPNKQKAKLRMDTEAFARQWRGKDDQPLWVPHKSRESFILKVTGPNSDMDDRMPPIETDKKMSPEEYKTLKRWIDEGAVWPTLPEAPAPVASAGSAG